MGEATKEYAAGLAAGVATVITGHPFDTVKLLFSFQRITVEREVKLQAHNIQAQGQQYRNALHCTARILSNEGVKGLYRGASSSFIGMAFESSLLFGIYSQMKQSLQGKVQSSRPQLQVIIPSAAYGGAIISFVLCPAELVKCRMQVQGSDSVITKYKKYSGPLDCALKTIQSEGIKGIFRGGTATLLRESIGNAVFFSTYEYSRYYMHLQLDSTSCWLGHQPKLLIDTGIGIMSGGLAGVAFWSTVLPLDVAKTVIQTSPATNPSTNPFQMLSSIYTRVGVRGCYAGLSPTLARAFPANAAAIVTWELAAKVMGINRV
ncbi:mitochondrial substrate carrier family protein isoform X2 [Tasmannia lanceolata]|uniref:mitochondrial substrate carrier family protein isoform X2 n=1 Tax=Tasmannia lanceolata TaxID=3420 RepID=UPI0040640A8D